MSEGNPGWIGVDFDGTLARYDGWQGTKLGAPIPAMVERVKKWLAEGTEVRVMTARVSALNGTGLLDNGEKQWEPEKHRTAIKAWCKEHIGQELPVTAEKDFMMVALYDDRAFGVEKNTGRFTDDRDPEYGKVKGVIIKHTEECAIKGRFPRGCYCGADWQ